ncbi:MAG: prohibitin family protein [Candidatus Melainabacteria bacterium]|nr:prohibitin family protein [Candidatus Melainabacteria bacterium]MBI3307912.1 prohibitin family protein [Candidatus Melainabacteria bacterium]
MPTDFEVPDFFTPSPKKKQEIDNLIFLLRKYWTYLLMAIIMLLVLGGAFVRVGAGERAVVFNAFVGIEKRVLGEGIHIVIPLIQRATLYDVKQVTYDFATEEKSKRGQVISDAIHALTSDGQQVDIELTVRARPQPNELSRLHQEIGPTYAEKIIIPFARSVLREVLASYPVEDVYSAKRQEIQTKIYELLSQDLAEKYFIDIEEVLIRNVKFSQEFQDAVDRKQQAYQEYLKMEYIIAGEEAKRDARILQAEGEAQAINLRVQALIQNPSFLKYRRAQVYGKRAKLIFSDTFD